MRLLLLCSHRKVWSYRYRAKHGNKIQRKPRGDGRWVNGGYFVLEPSVFDLITDDCCVWENEPLEELAKQTI